MAKRFNQRLAVEPTPERPGLIWVIPVYDAPGDRPDLHSDGAGELAQREALQMAQGRLPAVGDTDRGAFEGDPHALARFVQAQDGVYDRALGEIREGRKRSHWMWFIFPQFAGLGRSATSGKYAIKSRAEAAAYLDHAVLGPRLIETAEAVFRIEGRSVQDVFGSPDDMKLRSCATLFAEVSRPGSVFQLLLDKYFEGKPDRRTLQLLRAG